MAGATSTRQGSWFLSLYFTVTRAVVVSPHDRKTTAEHSFKRQKDPQQKIVEAFYFIHWVDPPNINKSQGIKHY